MSSADLIDVWLDLGKAALSPSAPQQLRLLLFAGRPAARGAAPSADGETASSDLPRVKRTSAGAVD